MGLLLGDCKMSKSSLCLLESYKLNSACWLLQFVPVSRHEQELPSFFSIGHHRNRGHLEALYTLLGLFLSSLPQYPTQASQG